jgi:hypothetical protein
VLKVGTVVEKQQWTLQTVALHVQSDLHNRFLEALRAWYVFRENIRTKKQELLVISVQLATTRVCKTLRNGRNVFVVRKVRTKVSWEKRRAFHAFLVSTKTKKQK